MASVLQGISLVTKGAPEFFIWEWELQAGVWICYDPHIIAQIADHRLFDLHLVPVEINGVFYEIDLERMVQRRRDTGAVKKVREVRLGGSWVLKGGAGEKIVSPQRAGVVEAYRRMGPGRDSFDMMTMFANDSYPPRKLHISMQTHTWTDKLSPSIHGTIERRLRTPLPLPIRILNPALWVPKRFLQLGRPSCGSGASSTDADPLVAFALSLPPFPESTGFTDWRYMPHEPDWQRLASPPALGVPGHYAWHHPIVYCLAYGAHSYQAREETVDVNDLLPGTLLRLDARTEKRDKTEGEGGAGGGEGGGGHDDHHHDHECRICSERMDGVRVVCPSCRFEYCEGCLVGWLRKKDPMSFGKGCPQCKKPIANCRGPQPSGWCEWWVFPPGYLPVPGYERHPTILLNYDFPDGEQLGVHRHPGAPFRGDQRVGFFPYCPQGAALLQMFVRCFLAGRMFTVSTSLTTGEENTLVWGGVHHKTSLDYAAPHGYPDESYFHRATHELRDRGIIPTAIEQTLLDGDPTPLGTRHYSKPPLVKLVPPRSPASRPSCHHPRPASYYSNTNSTNSDSQQADHQATPTTTPPQAAPPPAAAAAATPPPLPSPALLDDDAELRQMAREMRTDGTLSFATDHHQHHQHHQDINIIPVLVANGHGHGHGHGLRPYRSVSDESPTGGVHGGDGVDNDPLYELHPVQMPRSFSAPELNAAADVAEGEGGEEEEVVEDVVTDYW